MKDYALFISGTYPERHLEFYRGLCGRRTLIAVDGGYGFFRKTGLIPDVLIGDFDSIGHLPKNLPETTEVVTFPVRKDKTDTHLALDYCLERGARKIDIVMPGVGEIDHFIGTLMLSALVMKTRQSKPRPQLRFVNHAYEIIPVLDSRHTFRDCEGDTVSVVPFGGSIRLTCTGTDYPVKGASIAFGDSRGLRNRITAARAVFTVEGKALLIHR